MNYELKLEIDSTVITDFSTLSNQISDVSFDSGQGIFSFYKGVYRVTGGIECKDE